MKRKIKKIMIPVIIVFLIIMAIITKPKFLRLPFFKEIERLQLQKTQANVEELYIYGNHLNIKGYLDLETDETIKAVNIALYDGNELNYKTIFTQNDHHISFKLADKMNTGLLLDRINIGNYIMVLKVIDDKDNIKYYSLINKTSYSETEYYTISNLNKSNYILINNDKKLKTLNMLVEESKNNDVYDIVIDAGHGGRDSGACANGYCETDFTLELSKRLKARLEAANLKVKLTRDENITKDDYFPTYGDNGRVAVAGNAKAKYLFSFHINSGLAKDKGTEIFTANNIDYTLSKKIADNIVAFAGSSYSTSNRYKVFDGVYTRTFLNKEIAEVEKSAEDDNYEPYKITTDTVYYYIIRETGGYMTGAYMDGRNTDKDYNPYVNSNVGVESYIMELGYITSKDDINNIKNNMDKYVEGIAQAIIDSLCV